MILRNYCIQILFCLVFCKLSISKKISVGCCNFFGCSKGKKCFIERNLLSSLIKKMECVHQLMSNEEYNKKIMDLEPIMIFFFLMNTLLQIKFNRLSYCFYDLINQEKCLICEIITDFNGFEEELTRNMKNKIF